MIVVCKFLLEDTTCRYRCVGKIVVEKGELNANEARELFDNLGIKLPLTTTYKAKEIGN